MCPGNGKWPSNCDYCMHGLPPSCCRITKSPTKLQDSTWALSESLDRKRDSTPTSAFPELPYLAVKWLFMADKEQWKLRLADVATHGIPWDLDLWDKCDHSLGLLGTEYPDKLSMLQLLSFHSAVCANEKVLPEPGTNLHLECFKYFAILNIQ